MRALITRVGKLELRVPQDRDGRFSTELLDRYQRSEQAFADYLEVLKGLGFTPDGPLFPSVRVGQGMDQCFEAQGLSCNMWTSGAPIRQIFRDAFTPASLPYAIPH